ncbi:small RNA 2'-O-methyltransferase isoform 2-T2 [Spinachia spinachia]
MDPTFSPALHRQRHEFVINFVKSNQPKKVVDLGCGECSLLKQLKFHHEIELLAGVDIDRAVLEKKMRRLAPLATDYLQPRNDRLRIDVYHGSVTQKDARLKGFDLVTSIELIEHLSLADVKLFSEVVFGYMSPVAVIVSTPNADFNPLFRRISGFRHSDHKFEWSRAEFKSWALKVCLDYGFEVEFTGVGQAPPGYRENVGFCSQIGVFHRLGVREVCNHLCFNDAEDVSSYTLLYSKVYPSLRDNNILRRVLVSRVLHWAEKLGRRWVEEKSEGEGEERHGAPETPLPLDEKQTACGAAMKSLVEHQEVGELFWADGKGPQESCKLGRCVSVPLFALWGSCPQICALSGSLGNLRQLLMDDGKVKLSPDGSALLLNLHEQEDQDDFEDSGYGYAEAPVCPHSVEPEEDWDAYV